MPVWHSLSDELMGNVMYSRGKKFKKSCGNVIVSKPEFNPSFQLIVVHFMSESRTRFFK